jgi:hypothetical protein
MGPRNVAGISTPFADHTDVIVSKTGRSFGIFHTSLYLLLESRVRVRAFAIQIFVVVPLPLNTARRDKYPAKIHSHSTKTKREFMRRVNILENPSGNLAPFSFL